MGSLGTQRRPRGIAIVYAIIVLIAMLAIAAFAVDYGYAQVVRSQLHTALDAASLAGASGLLVSPTEARTRAKNVATANKVNGVSLTLLDSDIELGTWNSTTKTFTVLNGSNESKATAIRINAQLTKARNSQLNLMFAAVLGQKFCELKLSRVSGFSAGVDVVLVQDVTSSFSSELANAKKGDQALLDALNAGGGKAGLGVVAFTGKSKTIAPLQYVNSNYTALTNAITSLNLAGSTGMPIASGTDQSVGIDQGVAVFDAYTTPSATGKAMIMITDGEPTSNSAGTHPGATLAQLMAYAKTSADKAWAKNINVYVVFFNPTNSATAAANMKTLIRGSGDFVSVTDGKDLPTALTEITKKLPLQICK